MKIAGLDLSATGTGLSIFEDNVLLDFLFFTHIKKWQKIVPNNCYVIDKVKAGDENARIRRIIDVYGKIEDTLFIHYNVNSVCLEDYSYQKTTSSYQLAELGGYTRANLYSMGAMVRTHDPKSVKLFFTGNGNASKWDMIDALKTKLQNFEIIIPSNNIGKQWYVLSKDYMDNHYNKHPEKPTNHPLEGVVDSIALAYMLHKELEYRMGRLDLTKEPESTIRVFQRVTKAVPMCLIDRPFLSKEEG